ncbi:biopolymer transporter ExbD [Pseudoxanthomonas sp. SL93]|jgi:biopolymer transport protein ExbD|uniref:ExbD/TolR family protein n=1 Tax=Pseudoxanthomonas sp. SL93 TaxID=2995142 RepID=UPI00226D7955|nr:biopolymer transporter ExbD [Pseudoxanthomonas sp. SL93]WAC62443.1 biopolymer transporter ExbD [Pseudoxanthomonas sp. SL93]
MAFSAPASRSALADINITPLVDVMLVLLVIFMVTAPMLSRPLNLVLPQPTDRQVAVPPTQLLLQVDLDGGYRLDDRPTTLAQLRTQLEEARISDPRTVLQVQAAEGAEYQRMVEAMAVVEASGFPQITLRQ